MRIFMTGRQLDMRIFFKTKPGDRPLWRNATLLRRPRPLVVSVAALALGLATMGGVPAQAGMPLKSISPSGFSMGVDGFAPTLYRTSDGNIQQAWVIAHHGYASETEDKVTCVNIDTGAFCNGPDGKPTTWPKPLNTQASPLGAHGSNTGNLSTTQAPNGVIQTDASRVLRYPAITQSPVGPYSNGSVGVGCLNMQLQQNCGYIPLAPLTSRVGSNINGLSGLVDVGTKIYARLTTGQMACLDTATETPCPGQPFAGISPPSNDVAGLGPQNYEGDMIAIKGRIYTESNGLSATTTTSPHLPTLTCWDPVNNVPCPNWGARVVNSPDLYTALAIFPSFDAQGNETGVCTITGKTSTAGVVPACYDFFGNDAVVPTAFTTLFPTTGTKTIVFPPLAAAINGDARLYFPLFTQDNPQTHKGETLCFDWTTLSACAGFPHPLMHPMVNGGMTRDYGYAYNPQVNCIYGTGHWGFMFAFRPDTGAAGC